MDCGSPSHFLSFLPLCSARHRLFRFEHKTFIFQEGNLSLDSKSPVMENLVPLVNSSNTEFFSWIVNRELFFLLIFLRNPIDSFSLDLKCIFAQYVKTSFIKFFRYVRFNV